MSITQLVNQKDGTKAPMELTRGRAIRLRCLDCVGFKSSDVRSCRDEGCPLHPLRMGKLDGMAGAERARRITEYCNWCSGDQPSEKKGCPMDCPLFPFRYGTRLDRAGEIRN